MWTSKIIIASLICRSATASLRGFLKLDDIQKTPNSQSKNNDEDQNGYRFDLDINLDGPSTLCSPAEELEIQTMLWALVDTWMPIEMGKLDPKNPEISVTKLNCRHCGFDRKLEEEKVIGDEETVKDEAEQEHRHLPRSWGYKGRAKACKKKSKKCDNRDHGRVRRVVDLNDAVSVHVQEEFQVFVNAQNEDFCMKGNVDLRFALDA